MVSRALKEFAILLKFDDSYGTKTTAMCVSISPSYSTENIDTVILRKVVFKSSQPVCIVFFSRLNLEYVRR